MLRYIPRNDTMRFWTIKIENKSDENDWCLRLQHTDTLGYRLGRLRCT